MKKFWRSLMNSLFAWPDQYYMAGTEGTGMYFVHLVSRRGRVGVRKLAIGWRIRVEPRNLFGRQIFARPLYKHLSREAGWTQPGERGQVRFSRLVWNQTELESGIAYAEKALMEGFIPLAQRRPRPVLATISTSMQLLGDGSLN